jgi:hypothetical protein
MRTFFLAALAAVILSAAGGNAARADGSWCADYSRGAGTNCGFHSYGQCAATVSGVGGICRPNPRAAESYNYRRSRRQY